MERSKAGENEEKRQAYLEENQEETLEEVEERAYEEGMLLSEKVPIGFQATEDELNKNIKICSLIQSGEKENTLVPFPPSKLHESKPEKNHQHLIPFLTYQEPLLQSPLRSKNE